MLKKVDRIWLGFLKALCHAELGISLLCLVGIVGLNSFEIFRRQLFGISIIWVQEVTIFLMVWFTFMGFCYVSYSKKDIYITFLREKLPPTGQFVVRLIVIAGILVYLVPFTEYTWKLIFSQLGSFSSVARYPLWWKSAAALVGGVSLILVFVDELKDLFLNVAEHLRRKEKA